MTTIYLTFLWFEGLFKDALKELYSDDFDFFFLPLKKYKSDQFVNIGSTL